MPGDDALRAHIVRDKLASAIVDGRLQVLKGIAPIARTLGLTPMKAKRALEANEVENAWQTNGRWYAIRPVLLAKR